MIFLHLNYIFEKFQSAFQAHHSTEMASVKVANNLRINTKNSLSLLSSTWVQHLLFIDRLHKCVGFSCTLLRWLTSYLTGREFFVAVNKHKKYVINCGMPQGSILGPVLLSLHMLPLCSVIKRYGINFHSYTNDTQLYIAVSPDDMSPIDALPSVF